MGEYAGFVAGLSHFKYEGSHLIVPVRCGVGVGGACWVIDGRGPPLSITDWVPEMAPAPMDNFLGINRSVDSGRLAGFRFNCAGFPMEEAIHFAVKKMSIEGRRPKTFLLHPVWDKWHGRKIVSYYGPVECYVEYDLCAEDADEDLAYLVDPGSWLIADGPRGSTLVCADPSSNCVIRLN